MRESMEAWSRSQRRNQGVLMLLTGSKAMLLRNKVKWMETD